MSRRRGDRPSSVPDVRGELARQTVAPLARLIYNFGEPAVPRINE